MNNEHILKNIVIKNSLDRIRYNYLQENDKIELTKEIMASVYENSINKSITLKYDELEASKGDITKISQYKTLKGSLDLLSSMQVKMREKITGLSTVLDAHRNLIENKSNFETAFKLKNQHIILLYNNIAVALVCSVSFLIITTIDYIKDPAGDYEIHYRSNAEIQKQYPTVFLDSLERFNVSCKDGTMARFFKILYSKKSLVEDAATVAFAAAIILTAGLGVITTIIPLIREIIYQYYFMRIQIADYLRLQASFLEANRNKIENVKHPRSKDVIKKQRSVIETFLSIADKIDVDQKVSSREAKSEIAHEDGKLSQSINVPQHSSMVPSDSGADSAVIL